MARASLSWSRAQLAEASGVGVATVVRFETGATVLPETVAAMRAAFEARRVKFIEKGQFAGAVYGGMKEAP